ncbi:MAG TPA: bifunctional homocysteine S-methyltransferase/methylenetetrahydrofolate reductase [Streptosporangiaceae bacterium]|nr:bifunctional homocysteine S-methyltransferase/methylenetetrahydrofolate reductase [Streptosporangiaceae bacterium]
MTGFTDLLGQRLLVCDGAMGTMLHAAGCALDRALPEVNLSDPKLVAAIHESYLAAGADIIQTNTFGANRLWLAGHGYPDQVEEINRVAVGIAREMSERSGREVFVAGSVSPAVTARRRRQVGAAERRAVLAEQIQVLAASGVDLLILETFGYLDELAEAVAVAVEVCDVPVVAQATFADDGRTLGGETPYEVVSVLSELPIAMLGTNCTTGPQRMLAVVEDLVRFSAVPVSAQPNAGQPRKVGYRQFEFSIDASYFARYLRRFAEAGAAMVGGCCGTTPGHIEAAAASLADLPVTGARASTRPRSRRPARGQAGGATGILAARLAARDFVVAAQLPAADDGAASPAGGLAGGRAGSWAGGTVAALRGQGVELFAVAPPDGPRGHRDSLGMAVHLQQHGGVETIVTMTTWDKTIMTLQADLLGAHALGIRSVICETGNPPVLGDYPAVDGIWDVDSLGLVALLAGLNCGQDLDGLPLTPATSFCIGTRISLGAADGAAEAERVRAEVAAGAHFLITRPQYELDSLRQLTAALAGTPVPILLTVAPLRSFEEAEYLAHEVPEVTMPGAALRTMERAGLAGARAAGLELAADLLREARPLVDGVVLAAPEGDPATLGALLAASA